MGMGKEWKRDTELAAFQRLMEIKLQLWEGKKAPERASLDQLRESLAREVSDCMKAETKLRLYLEDQKHHQQETVHQLRLEVAIEAADVANQAFLLALVACASLGDMVGIANRLSTPTEEGRHGEA